MDYVLLAGYLKLIPSALCKAFRRRILNIHPGLLPSFGGHGYYGIKVGAREWWQAGQAVAAAGSSSQLARPRGQPAARRAAHAPTPALQVHQAVIASGARFSGPTIHFVDEEYDTGGCTCTAHVQYMHSTCAVHDAPAAGDCWQCWHPQLWAWERLRHAAAGRGTLVGRSRPC